MKFTFDALIVDAELDSRMRLRQAASNLPQFSHVTMANSLPVAVSNLEGDANCDVILLRPSFPEKDMELFIQKCKQTKQGQGCALILVVRNKHSDTGSIARSFAGGVDGFLSEPYSVETIQQIFEIAAALKQKKMETRCRAAIEVMLKKIVTVLDMAAQEERFGKGTGVKRELAHLCRALHELASVDPDAYQSLLVSVFESVQPPAPTLTEKRPLYEGASERVKKKISEEAEKVEQPAQEQPPQPKVAPARMVIRRRR